MVNANREEVGSASWALIRVTCPDKGSLLVHVEKEHPQKLRSQSNIGFIFTKTGMEGMCDKKNLQIQRLSRGSGWFVLLGPNPGSGPGLSSAALVAFQREQFLQAEQESCCEQGTGSRCCCRTPLKRLLLGKSPFQESITKKDILVLSQIPECPAPGCQGPAQGCSSGVEKGTHAAV